MASGEPAIAIALTTVDSEAGAAGIARTLVGERLVACVNIVRDVRSIYLWQGAVEDASEWLLVMKTAASRLDELRERLRSLHPYDTPEWLVLEASAVSEAYGQWLLDSVSGSSRPARPT